MCNVSYDFLCKKIQKFATLSEISADKSKSTIFFVFDLHENADFLYISSPYSPSHRTIGNNLEIASINIVILALKPFELVCGEKRER